MKARKIAKRVNGPAKAAQPRQDGRREVPASPTPEGMRKAAGGAVRGDTGRVTFRDSPLEKLETARKVTNAHYRAGEKLRIHRHMAGLDAHYSAVNLNAVGAGGDTLPKAYTSDLASHHREQYRLACQRLGLHRARIVEMIVCDDVDLAQAGHALGWKSDNQARAAAVEILRSGLSDLADMWGIT